MKRNLKKAVIAVLILSSVFSSAFAKEKKSKSKGKAKEVNVGYVDATGGGLLSDIVGVARDKGFFDAEFNKIGVKLNLVPMTGAGPAINEALAGGSLDIGELGDVPAVLGKVNGVDTKLISYGGLNTIGSVIAQKGTSYKSIKDLKGKSIATLRGSFMHRYLAILLNDAGLSFDDIEWINAQSNVATEMLLSGNVDAIVTGGVVVPKLWEQGYNVVVDGRNHPLLHSGGGTIARTKFVEQNPEIIQAYLTALAKAKAYAIKNTDALKDQWISTGETGVSYEYLYPNHDNYPTIVKTPETEENFKDVLKFLIDNDLTINKKGISIEDWYDGRFAEKAVEEASKK